MINYDAIIRRIEERLSAAEDELRALKAEKGKDDLPEPPHPRWMPMENEHYWYINDVPLCVTWNNDICDANWYEIGNVFKDKTAAEFAVERLKVLAEMREWAGKWHDTWRLYYCDGHISASAIYYGEHTTCGEMRFATEVDAINCIKAVGEERLIKYYFCVPELHECCASGS